MIWPETFLATASGLIMVSVRSTAIEVMCPFGELSYTALALPGFSPAGRQPVSARTSFADDPRHGRAHVGGAFDRGDPRGRHGLHLLGGRPFAAGDDGAG